MIVSDLMSRNPETCHPQDSLEDAVRKDIGKCSTVRADDLVVDARIRLPSKAAGQQLMGNVDG